LQTIVISRVCSAAFKYAPFDCQSHPSNSPIPNTKTGKRTHFLRTGNGIVLVPFRLGQLCEKLEIFRSSVRPPFPFGRPQIACREPKDLTTVFSRSCQTILIKPRKPRNVVCLARSLSPRMTPMGFSETSRFDAVVISRSSNSRIPGKPVSTRSRIV